MTNKERFLTALELQVAGKTNKALALMGDVEPMQEADSEEVASYIMLQPEPLSSHLMNLLVNSAIVGMTDQRASAEVSDKSMASFIRDTLSQNKRFN